MVASQTTHLGNQTNLLPLVTRHLCHSLPSPISVMAVVVGCTVTICAASLGWMAVVVGFFTVIAVIKVNNCDLLKRVISVKCFCKTSVAQCTIQDFMMQ